MTEAAKKPAARKSPARKPDIAKDPVEQAVETAEALVTVKVKTKFEDRLTGEIREPGTVLDITQARYDEIMAAGDFVVKQ